MKHVKQGEIEKMVGYATVSAIIKTTGGYVDSMTDPKKGFEGDMHYLAMHRMLERYFNETLEADGIVVVPTESQKPQE